MVQVDMLVQERKQVGIHSRHHHHYPGKGIPRWLKPTPLHQKLKVYAFFIFLKEKKKCLRKTESEKLTTSKIAQETNLNDTENENQKKWKCLLFMILIFPHFNTPRRRRWISSFPNEISLNFSGHRFAFHRSRGDLRWSLSLSFSLTWFFGEQHLEILNISRLIITTMKLTDFRSRLKINQKLSVSTKKKDSTKVKNLWWFLKNPWRFYIFNFLKSKMKKKTKNDRFKRDFVTFNWNTEKEMRMGKERGRKARSLFEGTLQNENEAETFGGDEEDAAAGLRKLRRMINQEHWDETICNRIVAF